MAYCIHCTHRNELLDQMPGAWMTSLEEEQHFGLLRLGLGVAHQSLGLIALLEAIVPCSGQLNSLEKLVLT